MLKNQKKKVNVKNTTSGITLIALIITIIVLLILAGVAIASLSGDNGLLSNSSKAKEEAVKAQLKEEIEMAIMDIQEDEVSKGNNVTLESLAGQEDDDNVGQLENNIDLQKGDITADLVENEITGEYKGYNYKIDGNLNVLIEDKATEENLRYGAYIKKHIQVDKIIYINSAIGDDQTGDGTKGTPYKTLDKIAEAGIIENDKTYAVMLMDGEYTLTEKLFTLNNCNKSINIFGNKEKTILNVGKIFDTSGPSGNKTYKLNFYRLIWKDISSTRTNVIHVMTGVTLNNVYLNVQSNNSYGYFCFYYEPGIILNNCTLPTNPNNFFRTNGSTATSLTNCYGGFTSGLSTTNEMWNYQTNYITTEPKVDETTYRITDEPNVWKNTGTGKDPDGSQADLGVYGGEYSWEK